MKSEKEILKITLGACEEPLEDIKKFLFKYGELQTFIERELGKEFGVLRLKIIYEATRARLDGYNLDVSSYAELCGVSRDTVRRMAGEVLKGKTTGANLTKDGRRTVFEKNQGVSQETAIVLDILTHKCRGFLNHSETKKILQGVSHQGEDAKNKKEVLETAIGFCKEPLEDVWNFISIYNQIQTFIEKKLGREFGVLRIRSIYEGVRARLDGINLDISAYSELCGVSRDTFRRMEADTLKQDKPGATFIREGRRKVYDENEGVGLETAKVLDELTVKFIGDRK